MSSKMRERESLAFSLATVLCSYIHSNALNATRTHTNDTTPIGSCRNHTIYTFLSRSTQVLLEKRAYLLGTQT